MSPVRSLLKGLQYIYSVINPLNHKSCRVFHTVYACALGNAAMLCLAIYHVEKDIKSFVKFSRLCYYGSLVLFSRDCELDLLWMTENVTILSQIQIFSLVLFIRSYSLRRRCKGSTLLFYTLLIKAVTSPQLPSDIVLSCGADRSIQVFDLNVGSLALEIPESHNRAAHHITQNKVTCSSGSPCLS